MEAAKDSFSRAQPSSKSRLGRLTRISAKLQRMWTMATCLFQLDCFRSGIEEKAEEDISSFKGISTYLKSIGGTCRSSSTAPFSRLPDSVVKENEVLAQARMKMLKTILARKQSSDMDKQANGSSFSTDENQDEMDSSATEIEKEHVATRVHSVTKPRNPRSANSNSSQFSSVSVNSRASTFWGTLKQDISMVSERSFRIAAEMTTEIFSPFQLPQDNENRIVEKIEVMEQPAKDRARFGAGQGESLGEVMRCDGCSLSFGAHSYNGSRLRRARRKVSRGITRVFCHRTSNCEANHKTISCIVRRKVKNIMLGNRARSKAQLRCYCKSERQTVGSWRDERKGDSHNMKILFF